MKNFKIQGLLVLLLISLACKSKTELYLERGLDILSNKEEINYNLYDHIIIEEIGIIRDQKEGIKTLVFKLNDSVSEDYLFDSELFVGVRVWIIDNDKNKRIENWDFKPKITQISSYKYILKGIKIEEDQIKKMKIYMYQKEGEKKNKLGTPMVLNKVNTYND